MSTNLIQNFTSSQTSAQAKPEFNIRHELDNRTFIKPLKGKGKLLSGNIFLAPKYTFDSFVYNSKAFVHAAKGQANDHELGKLNDTGLMLGGLSIATYLMSKRTTPMTKGMEFVGFGTFLASMALWPKIAIQLPAYLIHGVNVQKKYQDSFGRTKPFYQDPQFIPWDLYSDKEIDKIGNRLGVPKNIPNRRDFIQEKMKKLAVQNNTLWMLTAGFATPVMTGLVCNASEPYLQRYLNNLQNKKADKIINNIEKASKKYENKQILKDYNAFVKKYCNKPITPEIINELSEVLSQSLDFVTTESFKRDLTDFISANKFSIDENTAKDVSKNLRETLKGAYSDEFISEIIPDEDDMVRLFRDKNLAGQYTEVELNKPQTEIMTEITRRYNRLTEKEISEKEFKHLRNSVLNNSKEKSPIKLAFFKVRSAVFDTTLQAKLAHIANILDGFRAQNLVLDEYALIKTGAAPETVIANYWNEVSKDILNILGVSQKEIEKVRFDKKLMGQLLRDKIEQIVSDKSSYEKVLGKLVEKISSLDTKIKPSDISSHMLHGGEPTAYENAVDNVFGSYAKSLKEAKFYETAEAINGNDSASYKQIQKAFVEERLLGVKSAFNRLINTLDFFRRASTDPNGMRAYDNAHLVREVKEELIELCKNELLEGHSSDHATKFYMLRNPNPSEDTSAIEIENGKIKYKYVGNPNIQRTDIPGDKHFYQNAMKFMFEDDMHPETKAIIEKTNIGDQLSNYRRLILEKLGSDKYFWKPRHKVRNSWFTGSDIKFLLTGISPEELFYKTGQQSFNTNKWLKLFGGIGAGLLGLTVFAQFFLGRMKNPEVKK